VFLIEEERRFIVHHDSWGSFDRSFKNVFLLRLEEGIVHFLGFSLIVLPEVVHRIGPFLTIAIHVKPSKPRGGPHAGLILNLHVRSYQEELTSLKRTRLDFLSNGKRILIYSESAASQRLLHFLRLALQSFRDFTPRSSTWPTLFRRYKHIFVYLLLWLRLDRKLINMHGYSRFSLTVSSFCPASGEVIIVIILEFCRVFQ
jgi:hypothetical protein